MFPLVQFGCTKMRSPKQQHFADKPQNSDLSVPPLLPTPTPPPPCQTNVVVAWFSVVAEKDITVLVPMGLLHAVSHLTVVLGLGAGAVSFLQTVKASEACFTALLSFLFLGQVSRMGFRYEPRACNSRGGWYWTRLPPPPSAAKLPDYFYSTLYSKSLRFAEG